MYSGSITEISLKIIKKRDIPVNCEREKYNESRKSKARNNKPIFSYFFTSNTNRALITIEARI